MRLLQASRTAAEQWFSEAIKVKVLLWRRSSRCSQAASSGSWRLRRLECLSAWLTQTTYARAAASASAGRCEAGRGGGGRTAGNLSQRELRQQPGWVASRVKPRKKTP